MTIEEREDVIHYLENLRLIQSDNFMKDGISKAIEALKQKPIDKSALMHEIYMEGVNMGGEYQGCWVRFKNIEKIIDKYITKSEVRG